MIIKGGADTLCHTAGIEDEVRKTVEENPNVPSAQVMHMALWEMKED